MRKKEKQERLKVAICFFGHLRSYKKCAPFLRQNLLKYIDSDLFMHTWTTLDHNTKTWHDLKRIDGLTNEKDILYTYGEFKGVEIEEQHPKNLDNIQIKPNYNAKEKQISIFGMSALYHSMQETGRLCEEYATKHKIKYDYILFVRPDIWLKKPLKLKKILASLSEQQIKKGFFTLSHNMSKLTAGFENMGGTDLMFFAKPAVMFDIMKNVAFATKELKADMVVPYAPEYTFIKRVKERGFIPYSIDFKLHEDWDIQRASEVLTLRKRIISLRIRSDIFRLWLFPKMMRCIIGVQLNLFGAFVVDLALGNPGHKK